MKMERGQMKNSNTKTSLSAALLISIAWLACGPSMADGTSADSHGPKLLDLSGLAWIADDVFLAVSDAKTPDEDELNRVSLLELPDSLDGMGFQSVSLEYPGGPSNDFESAARVPQTNRVLLAESTDDNGEFQRIFLARVKQGRVWITDVAEWGSFTDVFNVESTAVAQYGSGYVFLWAERNSDEQSTHIKWTNMTLNPFMIGGDVGSVEFTLPDNLVNELGHPLYSRSIVGMELDSDRNIYTVAAFDPEGSVENPDNGPFRSIVFKVGRFHRGSVVLDDEPSILAMVDSLKIESVAVRENGDGMELFIGTDDENFGGILRQIPPLDIP
jgi:hypothetical protein